MLVHRRNLLLKNNIYDTPGFLLITQLFQAVSDNMMPWNYFSSLEETPFGSFGQ